MMMMMMMMMMMTRMTTTMMCLKCWHPAFMHKYDLQVLPCLHKQMYQLTVLEQVQPARKNSPIAQAAFMLCHVCGLFISAFLTKILYA